MTQNGNHAVTVIVPIYKGSFYIQSLLDNIASVKRKVSLPVTNVLFVNDSPWETISLESFNSHGLQVEVLNNEKNLGIHASRVAGLRNCMTEYVIFLDQDDELVAKGMAQQYSLIEHADIVVGNCLYQRGSAWSREYKNEGQMRYLLSRKRMTGIRNLLPSPGMCLIRKEAIPNVWQEHTLTKNGSDDWYLWLSMYAEEAVWAYNPKVTYRHKTGELGNLSFDLSKMYESSMEMAENLKNQKVIPEKEWKKLVRAIDFKYLQDSHQLSVRSIFSYIPEIVRNVFYKIIRGAFQLKRH